MRERGPVARAHCASFEWVSADQLAARRHVGLDDVAGDVRLRTGDGGDQLHAAQLAAPLLKLGDPLTGLLRRVEDAVARLPGDLQDAVGNSLWQRWTCWFWPWPRLPLPPSCLR